MVKSVEGIYRQGKVELLGPAPTISEARVIVTFLSAGTDVDLDQRGIGLEQAVNLRARLKTFEHDWQQAEMDVYDAL